MKQLIVLLILAGCALNNFAQQSFQLFSPDSSIRLEISINESLSYKLFASSDLLVTSPSIDLQLAGGKKLSHKIQVARHQYGRMNEIITVPIPYRRKKVINNYNRLKIDFRELFGIEFRLYNNGMAYRTEIRSSDSVTVESETALFDINPASTVWFANMDKRQNVDRYHTSFEAVYKKQSLSVIADTMLTFAPATISLPNGYHLSITDANLFDYPGMFLQKTKSGLQGVFAPVALKEKLMEGEFPQYVVTERAGYIARTNGTRQFPWRAVLVAKKDIDLPSNDLVYLLGDASKIADVSWIKYGKGTDEWITGINLFNVPFIAGLNTATYKYYIDFAKRFGFDQVMLDAGWSETKDLFKINPSINMEELVAYANKNK
ncbi:MAG: glycoside hydrolase family 97 N-terminal domain-containing protein, partial [Chitinophagales bacterium]